MQRPIRVRPGASRTSVGGSRPSADGVPCLLVSVQAPAVDGRANEAVLKALAKALGVRGADIRVVRGHTARTKLVEVDDALAERWEHLLLG